ncbi:MAG: spore coat protein [Peptococcaceae bacterium]|jgi:spore coat protein CotF|nr:spore coat protein [Peptococcaceae bacterium]
MQQQQQPYQQEKQAISTLLSQQKSICTTLVTAITECANNNVRHQLTQMLVKSLQNQKLVYDYMNAKGWYRVESAPQEQVDRSRQSFTLIQQEAQAQ